MRTKNFQTSLVLLKTDTVLNVNIWNVIKKIEQKKLQIVWLKMLKLDKENIFYISEIPVVVLAVYWNNSIKVLNNIIWNTEKNFIHISDNLENSQKELKIYFKKNEIFEYEKITCKNLEE